MMQTVEASAQQLPLFEHTPRLSSHEIRLLRFKSSNARTFEFELEDFPRATVPEYTALSYTWGENDIADSWVVVNGRHFCVRENLKLFLDELARKIVARLWISGWFWIDAVCINQLDDIEKAHQVMGMGNVFERARKVVIWLGPAEPHSDLGMSFVNDVAVLPHYDMNDISIEPEMLFTLFAEKYQRHLTTSDWLAYRDLLRRPWWKRAWVVQEASTSHSALVWCGEAVSHLVSFQSVDDKLAGAKICWLTESANLPESLTLLPKSNLSCQMYNPWVDKIHYMKRLRQDVADGNDALVDVEVLHWMRQFQCKDDRDKIYAFLSAFHGEQLYQVDYTKPAHLVYVDFARRHVLARRLDFLSACGLDPSHKLPSWVPEWSCAAIPIMFPKYAWNQGTHCLDPLYAASAGLPSDSLISVQSDELVISGAVVDNIHAVSPIRHGHDDDSVSASWMDFATKHDGTMDAFAHVLCADLHPYAYAHDCAKTGGFSLVKEQLRTRNGLDSQMLNLVAIERVTRGRKLLYTQKGLLGLGPPAMEIGDLLCVLCDCQMPFILRQQSDKYVLVGEAYVHGIMKGEAITPDFRLVEFRIT